MLWFFSQTKSDSLHSRSQVWMSSGKIRAIIYFFLSCDFYIFFNINITKTAVQWQRVSRERQLHWGRHKRNPYYRGPIVDCLRRCSHRSCHV
jgi:hypothetical protein